MSSRIRYAIGGWIKYAAFEEAQRDFERARSVYERALDVDHRNTALWLKYAEMEMRNRHINAARNVWDRAVTMMPRVDQFWFKYIYMEEMVGNIAGARAIFDRWTEWEPDDAAWSSYVRLELRANAPERARKVFQRYVACHNLPRAWIKWAKFEEKQGQVHRRLALAAPKTARHATSATGTAARRSPAALVRRPSPFLPLRRQTANARAVFEAAMQEMDERDHTEEFFTAFAQFEERAKEMERARAIYKYALDVLPRSQVRHTRS